VVLSEQLESRLANGGAIDIQENATLSSTLVRLAARIGIDRVPRDVTPTLSEYLAPSEAQDAGEDATSDEYAPGGPVKGALACSNEG
jgi:hypothetical protein